MGMCLVGEEEGVCKDAGGGAMGKWRMEYVQMGVLRVRFGVVDRMSGCGA